MMTLRPRGPSVTLTVLARMLSPLAMLWRALCAKTIFFGCHGRDLQCGGDSGRPPCRLFGSLSVRRRKNRHMRSRRHGVAQLPPPALLLGRRQGGEHRPGERGASPRASHDQRPDPPPRGGPRREAVRPPGTEPGAHRVRPGRVPLRRRDLLAGARVRRHAQGTGERKAVAAGRRRRGRASPVAGAAVSGARVPARPARPGHLPGGQVGAGVPRRAGAAQRGRRDRRRPCRGPGSRCAPSAIRWASAARRSSPPRSWPPSSAASFPARSMRPRFSCPARPRRFAARSSTGSTPRTSGRGSSPSWTTARWRRSSAKTAWACSRPPR